MSLRKNPPVDTVQIRNDLAVLALLPAKKKRAEAWQRVSRIVAEIAKLEN